MTRFLFSFLLVGLSVATASASASAATDVFSLVGQGVLSKDENAARVANLLVDKSTSNEVKTGSARVEIAGNKSVGVVLITLLDNGAKVLDLTCHEFSVTDGAERSFAVKAGGAKAKVPRTQTIRASCQANHNLAEYSVLIERKGLRFTSIFNGASDNDETDPRFDIVQGAVAK